MRRLRSWWHNENYDQEHMRRFREARPDLDDLPDERVARLAQFQWFAAGEAVREFGRILRVRLPIIDKIFGGDAE